MTGRRASPGAAFGLDQNLNFNPISAELFTSVRGEGAYLNQKRIYVSPVETLSKGLVATGFPVHKVRTSTNIRYYWEFTVRSHGVRRDGSAALDLASVAAGRFEAFWEFGLKPWDTAAGTLLIQEAGGRVGTATGAEYALGANIVAGNPKVYQALLDVIGPLTPASLRV